MPLINDIQDLNNQVQPGHGEAIIVIEDKLAMKMAFGLFIQGETTNTQLDGVSQLFDESLTTLSHPETVYFSESELPILTQIEQFSVAVVERDESGILLVYDGDGQQVENHIGLG